MAEGRLDGDEARSRLYDVMRADCPIEERLRRALEIGTEYFGVEYGYVTEVDPESDDWEVVVSTTPDGDTVPEGLHLAYATTYCRRTISEGGVALHDALEQGWEDDVAVETYGLRCYHGAPVFVDNDPYGTVCFASQEARSDPFSEAEKAFTDLVAGMVGHEIERQSRQADLDARERELEERREIYRAVVDASFDMVFRIDTEGRYTYQSSGTRDLLGYGPDELVGESYEVVLPDEETVALASDLFEQVLAGETIEQTYLPLETADGTIIYADVRVTPIYRADVPAGERTAEDIVAVQGTARDATERRERERLIRVLNRVLRHNLRNDMTVVRGHAEVLADRVDSEDATLVERIRDTADHLIALSETARDLEENFRNPPDVEVTNVVPTVERVARQIADQYPDADVTVDTPDRAVARTAPRLETAVWELLDNAARHAGVAPAITVSVAVDDRVAIRVSDDGPGLPDQEVAVLASGEETPLVHGSGLGLWLVHLIVASLDGDVRVPDTGEGACVEIRLQGV